MNNIGLGFSMVVSEFEGGLDMVKGDLVIDEFRTRVDQVVH